MGINNPLPSSMQSECKKCGKILDSFVNSRQSFGPDKAIPPTVLANAKGLAVLTVLKAGFLGSGRFGSGLVVARLPNGSWSAPSAIATAGAGVGGQIGFELTDFVFILNDASAVKTFAQAGSLTLGGNVSLAAGPIGRNAEAAGAASLKSLAAIFSYSKTRGLFAGVSLEGSAIIERRDANEKLYGTRYTALELLSGSVPPPHQAAPLMDVLSLRAFNGLRGSGGGGSSGSISAASGPVRVPTATATATDAVVANNQQPAVNSAPPAPTHGKEQSQELSSPNRKQPPGRPTAPKPTFTKTASSSTSTSTSTWTSANKEAIALYNFDADQPGDLAFKKGDVITVLKRTENESDWWTGMIGKRHGTFPSNYVKMRS